MKINFIRLLSVIIVLIIISYLYNRFSFNYLSLQPTISSIDENNQTIKFVYDKPTRSQIAGIAVYVKHSFYITDPKNKKVELVVSTIENISKKNVVATRSWSMSEIPYQGFVRLFLEEPINNPDYKPIVFTIKYPNNLDEGEEFIILNYDDLLISKYEMPRIIYHDSFKNITDEGINRFFTDSNFARSYIKIMSALLLLIIALYVIEIKIDESKINRGH